MNNSLKLYSLLITLLIAGCNSGYKNFTSKKNDNRQTDDYSAKIDSLIQTTSPRKFNGVILITQAGKTIYSKCYGYSDLENKKAITLNDNFRIQSNSKQITAVLILQEVEKGKIGLQDLISVHLPDLKKTWADTVTVHHLLNMSSGIVDIEKPLSFRPGTNFHYSNPAYGLLGKIIERSTGRSYKEAANALFKKLGMNNTYCYEFDKTNDNLVNGYWVSNNESNTVDIKTLNFTKASWANFVPAGGVISNPIDLNVWDTKLHNGEILKAETYVQMVNSSVVDMDLTFSDKASNYGYGVNINEGDPSKYIGHAGRGIGFVSLKFYVPAKKLDVIILENTYNRDVNIVYHFEKKIREIVLNSSLLKK